MDGFTEGPWFAVEGGAVVSDLVYAAGQDVLEESTDELLGVQRHCPPAGFAGFLVAEGDPAIVDGEDTAVGDSDAVDVTAEVFQHSVSTLDGRLAVDDSVSPPDGWRKLHVGQCGGDQVPEHSAEDFGQGGDRDQVVAASGDPASVVGDAAGGDQAMDVRVKGERSGPGVQDGHDADQPTDVMGIGGQLDQTGSGGLHHQAVEYLLVGPRYLLQFLGQGETEVEISDRQESSLAVADRQDHASAVDVLDTEMDRLGDAQATGIHQDSAHASGRPADGGQELADLVLGQDDGELAVALDAQQVEGVGRDRLKWLARLVMASR